VDVHIRAALRWAAGISTTAASLATVYGLVRTKPFAGDYIWLAAISLIAIVSTWLVVETIVGCKDELLKALPAPRSLVRATIQEMEEQAVTDAGLPHIADGQRQR
jgi:hypothetical protein